MSGWSKWGIRGKLFSIILLILVLNVLVLLFAGSWLFERFYTSSKINDLKNSAQNIRDAYAAGDESFYDEINTVEAKNAVVSICFFNEDGTISAMYHSRAGMEPTLPEDKPFVFPPPPVESMTHIDDMILIERLQQTDSSYDVRIETMDKDHEKTREKRQEEDKTQNTASGGRTQQNKARDIAMKYSDMHMERRNPFPDGVISLSTKMDDNLYLYMITPRGFIKSTADLAVKYTALLSIAILLAGAAVIYLLTGKITKPIRHMQEVAGKISRLDFTQKCAVRGGDEIAMLGESINNMSDGLQASIEKLVAANEVLQNDLTRQQQTDRMRRQFIANVSHDFKTPLTLMISYAEALAERKQEDEEQEYCEIIISEGNKLSGMVGRLLNLSKLENGIDAIEMTMFCLSEVIDEVVKNHKILLEKNKITLTKYLEEDFIVQGDYYKIEQAVTNLIENAVKYTPEGGKIEVRAVQADSGACCFSVENTGEPIAKEDLDSLFESFYRADKSRTVRQSFGLGLAIVKVIIEAHHQTYGVKNTDTGVCFWFTLEIVNMEEAE